MILEEFKSLGSEITIVADLNIKERHILLSAKNEMNEFELNFSRFVDGNELSKFNNSQKEERVISQTLKKLLESAKEYNTLTNGLFDPTIIDNLVLLGYDKDFDAINKTNQRRSNNPDLKKIVNSFNLRERISNIIIKHDSVACSSNFRLDLGGFGKGFIVDHLAEKYFSKISNYFISAGGDILLSGKKLDSDGWDVNIQNPLNPNENTFSINTHGEKLAIATSGIIKRQGQKGETKWHHIIDPRTGLPTQNNILTVTVIASNTMRADIFAKSVLIAGVKEGLKFIEGKSDAACIIFTNDTKPFLSSRISKYLISG